MNPFKLSTRAGLLAIALLPVTSFAQSASISLDFVSVAPSASYNVHAGDQTFDAISGLLTFNVTSQPTQLHLFCVELAQFVSPGPTNVFDIIYADEASKGVNSGRSLNIPLAGIGVDRARALEILYRSVFPTTYTPLVLTDPQRAGFQLAVWELSHDDDFHILGSTSGNPNGFWITSTVPNLLDLSDPRAYANALVENVQSLFGDLNAPIMPLVAFHSPIENQTTPAIQDFLAPDDPAFAPIPEPSTTAAILGLVVFAGVFGLRAKTRNAVCAA